MVVAKQVKATRVMLHVTTARTAAPDTLERRSRGALDTTTNARAPDPPSKVEGWGGGEMNGTRFPRL